MRDNQSLIYLDNRPIPCFNCVFCGNTGRDSRDEMIAWCHLQRVVVAPEIGCREGRARAPERQEAAR